MRSGDDTDWEDGLGAQVLAWRKRALQAEKDSEMWERQASVADDKVEKLIQAASRLMVAVDDCCWLGQGVNDASVEMEAILKKVGWVPEDDD